MANTLTNLQPDLYARLDRVSRELVGLIPSVSHDMDLAYAAKDQTIRIPVSPAASAADVSPGQQAPNTGDQTFTNKTISISKSRAVAVRWNGEEQLGMNTGAGYRNMLMDQFEQAMRTLVNEIEADLAGLYVSASRAVRPAGTNLFDAANYKDVANAIKELDINGAPMADRSLVLAPAAGALFMGNANYVEANKQGDDRLLRQGVLLDHFGMAIRRSNEIDSHTNGTASSATTDNAGYSIGDTVLTLASAGTGTIVAGDVISITGDASGAEYVVASGDADVSNGGTITLAAPGLQGALSAATHAITVRSDAQRNMAFSRNAIHLVTRLPARPAEGDMAVDVIIVQDPRSGLAFEIAQYKEYRQIHFEVSIAWGYSMIKPEHCILLID